MGTRSYTHIYEMPHLGGKCVGSFYRQFDSYLEGAGVELADWLKDKKLTNGWSSNKTYTDAKYYNRAGKMLVQLAASFGENSIEFVATDSSRKEEFTYHIRYDEDREKFKIQVESYYETFNFECFADEFEEKIKNLRENEEEE